MKCPRCENDKIYKDGKDTNGTQKYRCPKCGKCFNENTGLKEGDPTEPVPPGAASRIGMSLNDFRAKYDVEFIVEKTLRNLKKDVIYEQGDVYKLTGLRAGYPGLKATLEDNKFSQYRGRTGGSNYYSHPDTIKELVNDTILAR